MRIWIQKVTNAYFEMLDVLFSGLLLPIAYVLKVGLGISKLHFLIKNYNFFQL
jgi:hypothetical protein